MLGEHKRWIFRLSIFLLVSILFMVWILLMFNTKKDGVLTVSFLDVGQGDAIFIESPSGMQVLIDGGPNKKVLRQLGKQMSFWDRSIDVVVATHPDLDHIGGLPAVFSRFEVDYYMKSDVESNTGEYDALEERALAEAEVILARRGDMLDLGGGAYLEVLFPDRSTEGFDANLASVVLKLVYGETSFLFTGDAPKSIEKYLAGVYSTGLDVDVLKLGHHGSKTSTSDELLGYTTPDYAIISASADNRYGHPHKEVVERVVEHGVTHLQTAEEGSITFLSDGVMLRRK